MKYLIILLFPSILYAQNVAQFVCPKGSEFAAVSASDITGTASTAVKAATANIKYYITSIAISNMSATVATRVDVLCGSTVVDQCPAATGGGGCARTYQVPIVCAANTAINCQDATTLAQVRCSVQGCSLGS